MASYLQGEKNSLIVISSTVLACARTLHPKVSFSCQFLLLGHNIHRSVASPGSERSTQGLISRANYVRNMLMKLSQEDNEENP